jgi:hypothetical protein
MNVSSLSGLFKLALVMVEALFKPLTRTSGLKESSDVMDLRAIAKAPSGGELNNVTHRIGQTVTLYISQKIPQISLLTKKQLQPCSLLIQKMFSIHQAFIPFFMYV